MRQRRPYQLLWIKRKEDRTQPGSQFLWVTQKVHLVNQKFWSLPVNQHPGKDGGKRSSSSDGERHRKALGLFPFGLTPSISSGSAPKSASHLDWNYTTGLQLVLGFLSLHDHVKHDDVGMASRKGPGF
ncbi:uncharacterized protein LOC112472943 isoform X4 [Pteropus alecto]|uniref:uncharacterized protein LOC112472943 isoform X4 n=1 Tax=Pteropus alecto TaxID=9402 RepID=UPI000D5338B4|nr:uncharacterized protein LOC112472943 isoform X4 [Pteropus alecto]